MKKITFLFAIITMSIGFSQELVTTNGDFQLGDTTGWSGNAANVVTYDMTNYFNEANVTTAGDPWNVNLSYVLDLTPGTTYTLTFDAWTGTGQTRTMIAGIGKNEPDWQNDTDTVDLTETPQNFSLTLTAPAELTNSNDRILFDMGAAVGYVGIDNVSLVEVVPTCNDGIMNGDETGIDCGGPDCDPCASSSIISYTFDDSSSINPWVPLADASTFPAEASISFNAAGNGTGALEVSGVNSVDGAGRAYIFELIDSAFDYQGNSDVTVSFDVKFNGAYVGAALHNQIRVPKVGGGEEVINTFDIQNQGINDATWTNIQVDVTGLEPTGTTFAVHFNIAAGAFIGAGGTVLVDNIVVEATGGTTPTCTDGIMNGNETGVDCGGPDCDPCSSGPTTAAPTPPNRPDADVVSVFSDAYNNISVTEWGPNWGPSSARVYDYSAGGNAAKQIDFQAGQVFAGIDFASSAFDATTFTHFHMDYYIDPIPAGQVLDIKLSNHVGGAGETSAIQYTDAPSTSGTWVSLDILLDNFNAASAPANLDRSAIAQIVITGARADSNVPVEVYIDNVYFHKNTTLSNESFETVKFKAYPNPTNGLWNIKGNEIIDSVELFNVLGTKILTKKPNNSFTTIDSNNLSSGLYIAKVRTSKGEKTLRLIKQ